MAHVRHSQGSLVSTACCASGTICDGQATQCAAAACLVSCGIRRFVCVPQGTGIVDRDTRQNVMRHTAQKVRSMLQVERSEYHSDWLTSNRSVHQQLTCDRSTQLSCAAAHFASHAARAGTPAPGAWQRQASLHSNSSVVFACSGMLRLARAACILRCQSILFRVAAGQH